EIPHDLQPLKRMIKFGEKITRIEVGEEDLSSDEVKVKVRKLRRVPVEAGPGELRDPLSDLPRDLTQQRESGDLSERITLDLERTEKTPIVDLALVTFGISQSRAELDLGDSIGLRIRHAADDRTQ